MTTMAAEWTKLWSVRSTWWCLLSGAALLIVGAVTIGGGTATEYLREGVPGMRVPVGEQVISAVSLAQFALVALAMLTVTSEYASGGIRQTLQATPIRGRLLAAKALVVAPVLLVYGTMSGAVAALATYLTLTHPLFGGLARLSPGELALDLLRLGVVVALAGVMTIGIAAAVRSAAGTLTIVFMLLMGLPLVMVMTGLPFLVDLSMRFPMFAGLAFMDSSVNMTGGPMPYGPLEGLTWLVGWTGAALGAGYAVLRARDAT